jgi:hypothetical protein
MDKMMPLSRVMRALSRTFIGGLLLWLGGCSAFETPAKPGAVPAPASGVEYLLGAEDVLAIAVWKDEHLTKEVVVGLTASCRFPRG